MRLPYVVAVRSGVKHGLSFPLLLCACAFVFFVVLYCATMNRGIQGRDSGYYIARTANGEWRNQHGLVAVHPLHYGLARAVLALNLASPPVSVTFLSAVFGAMTVAGVLAIAYWLSGSALGACVAAAALGFSHTLWQMATIAEVYCLTTALLVAELICALQFVRSARLRWLLVAFFLNGLGCANHLQSGLSLPALAVLLLAAVWRRPTRSPHVIAAAALWMLGSLPYTGIIAAEIARGTPLAETIRSALVGNWSAEVLNVIPTRRVLATVAIFPLYCFPNVLLPLAAMGVCRARRVGLSPGTRLLLLTSLFVHALFVVRYSVGDQYTFFLPTYVLLAIFSAVGWRALDIALWPSWRKAIRSCAILLLLANVPLYIVAPALAREADLLGEKGRHRPYEVPYAQLLTPWSCADQAIERVTLSALELAGPSGLIVIEDSWQNGSAMLYQCQVEGRTNVVVAALSESDDQRQQFLRVCVQEARNGRRVVLVPAICGKPAAAPPAGTWRAAGDLYVLDPSR